MKFPIISIFFLALAAFSCDKVEIDTQYRIEVFRLETSSSPGFRAEDTFGYILYGLYDYKEWYPLSWEDAQNGILTCLGENIDIIDDKETGEITGNHIIGEKSWDLDGRTSYGFLVFNHVRELDFMIMVIDPINQIVAWRSAQTGENLPVVETRLEIVLDKGTRQTQTDPETGEVTFDRNYSSGKWNFRDFRAPLPPEPDENNEGDDDGDGGGEGR